MNKFTPLLLFIGTDEVLQMIGRLRRLYLDGWINFRIEAFLELIPMIIEDLVNLTRRSLKPDIIIEKFPKVDQRLVLRRDRRIDEYR